MGYLNLATRFVHHLTYCLSHRSCSAKISSKISISILVLVLNANYYYHSWHSFITLIHDTRSWHSFMTLIHQTYSSHSFITFIQPHSSNSFIQFIHPTHSSNSFIQPHSSNSFITLIHDAHLSHSFITLIYHIRSFITLIYDTGSNSSLYRSFPLSLPQFVWTLHRVWLLRLPSAVCGVNTNIGPQQSLSKFRLNESFQPED